VTAEKTKLGASVLVVGGGVTGLSTAWWLAKSGVDVLVLEKGIVGWEASGRNGGGTTHFHSSLFQEEQRLWPMMDEMLGYPTEYRRERLIIALTEQELDFYSAWRVQGRRLGFRVTDLDPKQVRELAPLASEANLGGMHLHFGGHANPQRTAQAYAWALQDLGGRIFQYTPALKLIRSSSGDVVAVQTHRGELGLDTIVIAAGPQTGALLQQVGVEIPLGVARAEMIVTEPAPLMPVGGVDGNGLYGRQTLRGNLAFGGGPHEWVPADGRPLPRPTSPLTRNLALRLAQLMPGSSRLRLIRSWAGLIENTPDGRPVLDRLQQPGNLVVATMSSVGFGLSPAVGRAVRDLVIEGRCTFTDLDKYKLSRFASLPWNWREARGWVPPSVVTTAT
jgi:sarcosine oxidase subunit beta